MSFSLYEIGDCPRRDRFAGGAEGSQARVDLAPSAEQRQLVDAFSALYADLCTAADIHAAEPLGHDPALWQQLISTDVVAMALPEACGGYGASLVDLCLVAEQHGRYVAPAPVVEAQVAARLFARLTGGASPVLADVAAGRRLLTLALRPAAAGKADLVPAGAIADNALVVVDDAVVLVPLAGRGTAVDNLGCLPLADVADVSGEVIASGPDAIEAFATAIDEWRVLTAAALYGIAARSLEIAVGYVKERQAFGRPLGAFQGVAHRLADRATEVDGAQLLAREAAWSQDAEPGRFSALAAMALGFAAETARDTTYFALHFHGGYGFMLEYPIQLYFRRARTWGAILESPADSFRRVGDLRLVEAD
jgi:alkylation response protein AidB-like acyl-CoA dehydrogenase